MAEPYRGSLVGREHDLEAVETLLRDGPRGAGAAGGAGGARLVTLLGPGGVGKTRLLHRTLARIAVPKAWFCDLTSARSAGDVITQVATTAFGAATLAGTTAEDAALRVGHALARCGRCLLALDNLEQLEAAAWRVLGAWLGDAPELVVITTSRVTLGLPGEVVHRLAPLSLMRDASGVSPALRLFEERARAVRDPFTAAETDAVERIVTLLDGMPLALEMAATRLAVLRPVELLERLARPLDVLGSATQTDPDRHASLSRVLDGSWRLLDEEERRALADLSVFVGGFAVEACEALLPAGTALVTLQRLVDSSLVRPVPSRTGRARHAPWEVVREYALEKLIAERRLDDTKQRHAEWFASWADSILARLDMATSATRPRGVQAETAFAELVDEEPNLAAAAAYAALGTDGAARHLRLRLLCALEPVRMLRGQLDVMAQELAETLADLPSSPRPVGTAVDLPRPPAELRLVARSHLSLARSLHELGRAGPARVAYARAIADAHLAADATLTGLALCGLGRLIAGLGEWEEALEHFEEARLLPGTTRRVQRLARACFEFYGTEMGASSEILPALVAYVEVCRAGADSRELWFWLVQLGRVESELYRDRVSAERHFDEGLAIARELGDLRGQGYALFGLGTHWMTYGALDEALIVLEESRAALREAGGPRYEAWVVGFLGVTNALRGDHERARVLLDEAASMLEAVGDAPRKSLVLAFSGAVKALAGDAGGALRDLGAARAIAPATSRYHGWTIELAAAQVDLAEARACVQHGTPHAARPHEARAEALLARAGWPRGGAPERREWPWGGEFLEPRAAAQLLENALAELASPKGALRLAADGSYFVLPDGARVTCPGRGKLHGILLALARARVAKPGIAVPAATLIEAAWGDERVKREAAANRLHVALDNLRKRGLRSVLLRGDGGWLLDPTLPFAWADVAPLES